jgi:hypothetical protein
MPGLRWVGKIRRIKCRGCVFDVRWGGKAMSQVLFRNRPKRCSRSECKPACVGFSTPVTLGRKRCDQFHNRRNMDRAKTDLPQIAECRRCGQPRRCGLPWPCHPSSGQSSQRFDRTIGAVCRAHGNVRGAASSLRESSCIFGVVRIHGVKPSLKTPCPPKNAVSRMSPHFSNAF